MRTKRATIIGIALLTTLVGAAACTSIDKDAAARDSASISEYAAGSPTSDGGFGADSNSAGNANSDGEAAEVPSPGGIQATQAPAAAGENAATGINTALANRQVIKTATVQVELTIPIDTVTEKVEDVKRDTVAGATANLSAQATVLGGFVGSLDQSGASATLLLRVPVDKYDALLKAVGTVGGQITHVNEAAQDVTAEVTDIESRIKSQKISVERIRALLGEATNLEDIIRLESELSTREADLESWQGQLAVLSDQVSLSTISVTFTAVKDYVPTERPAQRSGFTGGLATGWDSFTNLLTGVAVLIGTLLPFTPLLAVLFLVFWFLRRQLRSRPVVMAGALPVADPSLAGGPSVAGFPATGHPMQTHAHYPGRPVNTPPIPPAASGTAESQQ